MTIIGFIAIVTPYISYIGIGCAIALFGLQYWKKQK